MPATEMINDKIVSLQLLLVVPKGQKHHCDSILALNRVKLLAQFC